MPDSKWTGHLSKDVLFHEVELYKLLRRRPSAFPVMFAGDDDDSDDDDCFDPFPTFAGTDESDDVVQVLGFKNSVLVQVDIQPALHETGQVNLDQPPVVEDGQVNLDHPESGHS